MQFAHVLQQMSSIKLYGEDRERSSPHVLNPCLLSFTITHLLFPPSLSSGTELRACMDYFDPSGDGTRIDYNAFCRLFRYKEPEGLPQVQRLVSTQHGCCTYTDAADRYSRLIEPTCNIISHSNAFYFTQCFTD